MNCPGCGSECVDYDDACECCGTPLLVGAGAGEEFVEMPDEGTIEIGERDLDSALSSDTGLFADEGGEPFRIDDDLFPWHGPLPAVPGAAPDAVDWSGHRGFWPETGADLPGPEFTITGEEHPAPNGAAPIIDRDDEVPERYWAPEVAGLGRRALALLLDQVLLAVVLGVFFLGAAAALRSNGIDGDVFLDAAGLQASALPFGLLAAALSLAGSLFFHVTTGRTPGKALVGIEVRRGDGGALSWSRATVRWFGAVVGVACAGVGIVWALFEPRRRSWADLLSGTLVARPHGKRTAATSRR